MKTKKSIFIILSLAIAFLCQCSNSADTNSNVSTTQTTETSQPGNNNTVSTAPPQVNVPAPPDSSTFEYIIYLHDKNKTPNDDLIRKYIYTDLPEDNPDQGKYYHIFIREIYTYQDFFIMVYEFGEEDYGSSTTNNFLATFKKDGEKIDEITMDAFMESEWNNVNSDEEDLDENIFTRVTTETLYAPDNKGGTEISRTETNTEKYKIDDDGKITELK